MMNTSTRHLLATALICCTAPAVAEQTYQLDIEAQPLRSALRRFAEQSGLQIVYYTQVVEGWTAVRVAGTLSASEALGRLLDGAPLTFQSVNQDTIAIRATAETSGSSAGAHGSTGGANQPPAQFRQAQVQTASPQQETAARDSAAGAPDQGPDEVVIKGAKRKFAPSDSSVATKIPLDIAETPQAITVLTSEMISIAGAQDLQRAMALIPSTVSKEGDTALFIRFVTRGFLNDDWNGRKINGISFGNTGGAIDLGITDRIESVRGPASIVYGQSDYGSTLNIQLKMPQSKPALAAEMGGDLEGSRRFLSDVTGPVTADGRLRARLIAIYDDSETPQDLTFSRTSTIAPSFSWDITDTTTFDFNFFHGDREARRGSSGFALTTDNQLPDISPDDYLGSHSVRFSSRINFGLAKLTQSFGNSWTLTASAARSTGTTGEVSPLTVGKIPDSGMVPLFDGFSKNYNTDSTADLTLTGNFQALGRSHTVMIDGSTRRSTGNGFAFINFVPLGFVDVFNPDPWAIDSGYSDFLHKDFEHHQVPGAIISQHTERKDEGISGLLLLHPADRVSVMMGARWSQYAQTSVDFWNRSLSLQTPARYRNDGTTYRAGAVYKLNDLVNTYLSYSTGLRYLPGQTASGDPLPPESGAQWEVGAKASLLDSKLSVAAALFRVDRNDVAIKDPDAPLLPYFITINGESHRGFELEAMGEPIPGWNILGSYSYLDVDITKASNISMIGQQPANSPHHMLKLFSTYQLLGGPLHGLSFGGGLNYNSDREVDNFGTLRLPAYTRLDLRLGYDALEHVSFSLNVINVADKKIYSSTASLSTGYIDFQDRRTAIFRINFKY